MALVNFRKGLLGSLPATYSEGTFYVTTDERAIYLDVSDSARIRLGDFQEFATVEALTANPNPNTTALYYVTDINCLAKWNGSEYIQINKDTGATSIEVTGTGNAVTAAVYDANNRKITLTKGATFMTAADVDSKIVAAVGTLGNDAEGNAYENVKAYVDAKTAGIATDAALGELTGRVEAAEDEIDAIQTALGETTDVTGAIADAKKAGTDAQAAAEAAQNAADTAQGEVDALEGVVAEYKTTNDKAVKDAADAAAAAQATADSKVTMEQVEAKDYATTAEAQGYANAKDEAIGNAQQAADDAQAAVDALAGKVGEVPEDKTVIGLIEEAKEAASGANDELAGRVKAIEDDYLVEADKTELSGLITAEAERAAAAEQVNAEAIAAVKKDVDDFFKDALGDTDTQQVKDTLREIQDYIESDVSAADEMMLKIGANEKAIEDEAKRAGEAETALSGRLDVLEAIEHDTFATKTEVEAVQQAVTDEAARADAAEKAIDAKVEAIKGDYLKAADKEALQGGIDANAEAIGILNGGTDVAGSVDKKIADAISDANLDQYATDDDLTGVSDRVKAIEDKNISDGANKVEASDTNGNIKIDGVETVIYTHPDKHAIADVDGLQAALDAKATTDALNSEIDRAKAAEEANTAAIEANAGEIAKKANSADVYLKTETYNKDEIDAKLTWGSF